MAMNRYEKHRSSLLSGLPYRTKLLLFIIAALGVSLIFFGGAVTKCMGVKEPLDLIESYNVDVTPRSDGSLDISYDIRWKVLDGDSEGPVSWIYLGLANNDCEVVSTGGNVKQCEAEHSKARIDLDRAYATGETAEIIVRVHQWSMLCRNQSDPQKPFYEFYPGWFDDIEVSEYRFTWHVSDGLLSANNDSREGDLLVWSGRLEKGETRKMRLTYDIGCFDDPQLVYYSDHSPDRYKSDYEKDSSNYVKDIIAVSLMAAAVIIVVLVSKLTARRVRRQRIGIGSYSGGRGFGGHTRGISSHHIGGHRGCACACAGCACACACAGGGRAGCSVKDYYNPERDG